MILGIELIFFLISLIFDWFRFIFVICCFSITRKSFIMTSNWYYEFKEKYRNWRLVHVPSILFGSFSIILLFSIFVMVKTFFCQHARFLWICSKNIFCFSFWWNSMQTSFRLILCPKYCWKHIVKAWRMFFSQNCWQDKKCRVVWFRNFGFPCSFQCIIWFRFGWID